MTEVPRIETERLVLRGWRDADTEAWAEISADPEVMRWLGHERGLSLGDAWRQMSGFVGHWALRGFGHWALELRETGELAGRAGLLQPPDWPALEVGWAVKRSLWGRGLAGEAGRAAMDWARDELGADHVISLIADDNRASQRVAEKLGMSLEGRATVRGYDLRMFGVDL